jgi:hypothetical protein
MGHAAARSLRRSSRNVSPERAIWRVNRPSGVSRSSARFTSARRQNNAAVSLVGQDPSINTIYASNDLDEEQDFMPVIDAIQGDGFNPLWRQVLIVFNAGFTPHQFVSDTRVLAAAAGANPEVTLVVTDEMYRYSVVGQK